MVKRITISDEELTALKNQAAAAEDFDSLRNALVDLIETLYLRNYGDED